MWACAHWCVSPQSLVLHNSFQTAIYACREQKTNLSSEESLSDTGPDSGRALLALDQTNRQPACFQWTQYKSPVYQFREEPPAMLRHAICFLSLCDSLGIRRRGKLRRPSRLHRPFQRVRNPSACRCRGPHAGLHLLAGNITRHSTSNATEPQSARPFSPSERCGNTILRDFVGSPAARRRHRRPTAKFTPGPTRRSLTRRNPQAG